MGRTCRVRLRRGWGALPDLQHRGIARDAARFLRQHRLATSSKKLDPSMAVAKAFIKDMKLYFAEPTAIKRDEIAGRQFRALRQYTPRYGKKLCITDVIEMFQEMRDQV